MEPFWYSLPGVAIKYPGPADMVFGIFYFLRVGEFTAVIRQDNREQAAKVILSQIFVQDVKEINHRLRCVSVP